MRMRDTLRINFRNGDAHGRSQLARRSSSLEDRISRRFFDAVTLRWRASIVLGIQDSFPITFVFRSRVFNKIVQLIQASETIGDCVFPEREPY